MSSLAWSKFLMGAPPIHNIPSIVNDSLSLELNQVERGVMNSSQNGNTLKVGTTVS